jgi:hypothetical protein
MSKLGCMVFLVFLMGWSKLLIAQETAYIDSIQINTFLQKTDLDKSIRIFYKGKFEVSDNEETFELLKMVTSKDDELFPIYFNTLNKIVEVADGALAEILPDFCFEMIFNYPHQTFEYFNTNREILFVYAELLGYEFYFQDKGMSDLKMNSVEFQDYLKKNLDFENMDIERVYSVFFERIRETIEEMN